MFKHGGKKTHCCKKCSYTSIKASNLKRHNLVHSGETPIVCKQCNYSCIRGDHLKQNMRIHTGEAGWDKIPSLAEIFFGRLPLYLFTFYTKKVLKKWKNHKFKFWMIFIVFLWLFLPIQFYNSKYWKNGVKMSQINVKYINLPISSFQKRFKSKK